MKNTKEEISNILDNLIRSEEIYACMLISKGMQGIVSKIIHKEILPVWSLLQKTMDDMFVLIEQYSEYNLGEIYFRLMDYEVILFVIPNSNTALVAITSSSSNRGLVLVKLEKARKDIIRILK